MKIEVLTLFPEFVEQITRYGVPRIADEGGRLQVGTRNPRDYSGNRHRRVDDRPYGGGPGMVMQAEALAAAIAASRTQLGAAQVLSLSPQGQPLSQALLRRLAEQPAIIMVCGRYEGIDERLLTAEVDLEVSLGDFVLSGGEIAAMAVIDGIARLLPGVLGHEDSAEFDSFSAGLLDHPHYSRPEQWREAEVPEVLLSGDHARIARWRRKRALGATWLKRPDLLDGLELDEDSKQLLREFIAQREE